MKKQILIYKTMTLRERIVNSMLLVVGILIAVYCTILISLVFSVISHNQAIAETKDLVSQLSSVESAYASKLTSIDDSVLAANGFVRLDGTTLTVRKDPIAGYTLLYEQ